MKQWGLKYEWKCFIQLFQVSKKTSSYLCLYTAIYKCSTSVLREWGVRGTLLFLRLAFRKKNIFFLLSPCKTKKKDFLSIPFACKLGFPHFPENPVDKISHENPFPFSFSFIFQLWNLFLGIRIFPTSVSFFPSSFPTRACNCHLPSVLPMHL